MRALLMGTLAAAMLATPRMVRAQGESTTAGTDSSQTVPNRVVAVQEGGSVVTLADGTEWRVYLSDRPTADAWRRGDHVHLAYLPVVVGDTGQYRYLLVNDTTGSRVAVRYVGRANALN
jgi:hypothetical protein